MSQERPILFSGPMVRAILDGRKTQTRRVIRFPAYMRPEESSEEVEVEFSETRGHSGPGFYMHFAEYPEEGSDLLFCPYGQPGDRLWVRETFAQVGGDDPGLTVYRADYPQCVPSDRENVPEASGVRWRPSIFMPRGASRLTLEVTDIRVQRVQEISDDDIEAEGLAGRAVSRPEDMRGSFSRLWDKINAKRGLGWDANPWVWAVTFKKI